MLEEETQKHFLEAVKRTIPEGMMWLCLGLLTILFGHSCQAINNSSEKKDYEEIFDYWENNKIGKWRKELKGSFLSPQASIQRIV